MHARDIRTSTLPYQPAHVADGSQGTAAAGRHQAGSDEAGVQLRMALRRHDVPAVRQLLQAHPAAVRWCDELGNTALHTAILSRCEPRLVDLLLAHRADPAVTNRNGDTCMHLAVALRPTMPAVVQSLVDSGRWFGDGIGLGALGMPNGQGRTALDLVRDGTVPAVGHAAILPVLESVLMDWMAGFRASLLAAVNAGDANAVRRLVSSAAWRVDMPIDDHRNLLQLALMSQSRDLACAVIDMAAAGDRGVLEQPDELGMTPLMAAVAIGAPLPIAQLLRCGVEVDARGLLGITAMHLAASEGNLFAVGQLLGAGADPDARRHDGVTPMMLAAMNGQIGIIKVLCDAGGNINGRDALGRTPIMHACMGDQSTGMSARMVLAGARTDMADDQGASVKDYQRASSMRRALNGESRCAIV